MKWRLAVGLASAILVLLVATVNVVFAKGYSELIPCSNGVYLLVEDNGYVVVYAVPSINESEAIRIALECLQLIDYSQPMLQEMLWAAKGLVHGLEGGLRQVEEGVNLVKGGYGQSVIGGVGKLDIAENMASARRGVGYIVSPTMSMFLVILCILLGYTISKFALERVLGR